MQARLAYSIAIQVDFDILLLDEVLAVGDQRFQEKCYATFEGFRQVGKTVIFVSHDLESVGRFCDRVLLLEGGVSRACDRTERVVAGSTPESQQKCGKAKTDGAVASRIEWPAGLR